MITFPIDLTVLSPDAPRVLWRNDALEGSISATLLDPMTWNLAVVPSTITAALTNPIACNSVGIARGNWSGQIVTVSYNDGAGWVQVGAWQPVAGQPFLGVFDFQTAANWRIQILNGALTAAHVKLGMSLGMQRNTYGGNEPITKRVNTAPKTQMGAHFTGKQLRQVRREQSFQFDKLTPEWVRAYLKPMVQECRSGSLFAAWRPGTYPREVIYGFCDDDIKPSNEMANGMMKVSFDVEGSET